MPGSKMDPVKELEPFYWPNGAKKAFFCPF